MANPVNKEKLRAILGEFMESIEEWQSMVEGTPTKADFASLDDVYNDAIDQLDAEYFKSQGEVTDMVATDPEATTAPIKSAPQSPPKARDSLNSIIDTLTEKVIESAIKIDTEEFTLEQGQKYALDAQAQAKTAIRHLSTKEMLELIGPDEPTEYAGTNASGAIWAAKEIEQNAWRNKFRAELRAALTREET